MKIKIQLSVLLLILSFFCCKKQENFPKVKNLSEFKDTELMPTLEHHFSKKKKSVYCATLLFAWNEIRKNINEPFLVSNNYSDLKLLNKSTSFQNV
jgi:hypothetical protein